MCPFWNETSLSSTYSLWSETYVSWCLLYIYIRLGILVILILVLIIFISYESTMLQYIVFVLHNYNLKTFSCNYKNNILNSIGNDQIPFNEFWSCFSPIWSPTSMLSQIVFAAICLLHTRINNLCSPNWFCLGRVELSIPFLFSVHNYLTV